METSHKLLSTCQIGLDKLLNRLAGQDLGKKSLKIVQIKELHDFTCRQLYKT